MRRRRRKSIPDGNFQASIHGFSHDCRGISKIDGKTVFIQGALPGETVCFAYTSKKKDYDEGKVVEVIQASEDRVQAECEHFDLCGGCSLQHLSTDKQIEYKQTILLDLISRYGKTSPEKLLSPIRSQSQGYRNKARLSARFVQKKDSVLLGFRERFNGRFITDINHCTILHPKVGQHISLLRKLLDSLENKQAIAQVELAAGDSELALIFRNLEALSEEDIAKLCQFGAEQGFRIILQPGAVDSLYSIYPEDSDNYLSYRLPAFDLDFKFHPADFTQVNAEVNQAMVSHAIALMKPESEDIILDLFCGLGNFSLALAKSAKQVIGVEGSDAMVERATMNAEANQIKNVSFYAANLDDPEKISQFINMGQNKLLIDPPRSGALEIVKKMDCFKPERIVYVSCNPVTLARDTEILVHQHHYKLESLGVMDMFPHTSHVESIAVFCRS
jgi:23S rRNA (uracil1939-C5)-methyltransferase